MTRRQRRQFLLLIALWLVVAALFWNWWFSIDHVVGWTRFFINTSVVCWSLLMPAYYFFFVFRMKKPNPHLPPPPGMRVAMVVTKVPSEPFDLVKKTLLAMLEQSYPHDTWLADEDPSEATSRWCDKHGVRISTRKGVAEYHRATWPRRTRCKEGNLAYFYDHYGYELYDVVVQMDADHEPRAGYLEEMVRPFIDPEVGYVSAPSICDANADTSWVARARCFAESHFHGPAQAGYSGSYAPLCIGSHYAVRTAALKEAGGLGPELAEDHSTTFLMNSHGWKGVHAFEAEAHGHGPVCFQDYVTQEYQWSKSVTTILLTLTPKFFRSLPGRLKFQFLFAQCWYFALGMTMLANVLIPPVALLTDTPWVRIVFAEFILFMAFLFISIIGIVAWLRSNRWLRPIDSRVLSWEAMLFHLTRWPWVVLGCFAALIQSVRKKKTHFRITPKGNGSARPLALRFLLPYMLIVAISLLPAILIPNAPAAAGYYFFSIISAIVYSLVILIVVYHHHAESRRCRTEDLAP